MDDQTAESINEKIARTSGKQAFRPFREFLASSDAAEGPREAKLPEVNVGAWIERHPGSLAQSSLKLRFGFPEKRVAAIPCLAVQPCEDGGVRVLNVDGTTHHFSKDEFEK